MKIKENLLGHRTLARYGLLVCALFFLLVFAWKALAGAFRQLSHAHTVGQKVETATQIGTGILTLLVVLTRFWNRHWAPQVHTAWSIYLATAAGLSSLVWGPPMPFIGLLFVTIALLFTRAARWALYPSR